MGNNVVGMNLTEIKTSHHDIVRTLIGVRNVPKLKTLISLSTRNSNGFTNKQEVEL